MIQRSAKQLRSPFSKEGINPGPHYTFNIGSIESFGKKMDEAAMLKEFPGHSNQANGREVTQLLTGKAVAV